MLITLFDYGAGNLHSLVKALEVPDATVRVETDPRRALETDLLVLPGVGAFAAAVERLAPARDAMRDALADGLPCIGICLGMQLLLDASDEGEGGGLGLVPGRVRRLRSARVPQIGWNDVRASAESVGPGVDSAFAASGLQMAYYANSFVCEPEDAVVVTAWSEHDGDRFPASLRAANTVGVQFHPEKSSTPGVRFLRALVEEAHEITGGTEGLMRRATSEVTPDVLPEPRDRGGAA